MKKLILLVLVYHFTASLWAQTNIAVPSYSDVTGTYNSLTGIIKFYLDGNVNTLNVGHGANGVCFFEDDMFVAYDDNFPFGHGVLWYDNVAFSPTGVFSSNPPVILVNNQQTLAVVSDETGNIYTANFDGTVTKFIRTNGAYSSLNSATARMFTNGPVGGILIKDDLLWATSYSLNTAAVLKLSDFPVVNILPILNISSGVKPITISNNYLQIPEGIVKDNLGNVWIANNNNNSVIRINASAVQNIINEINTADFTVENINGGTDANDFAIAGASQLGGMTFDDTFSDKIYVNNQVLNSNSSQFAFVPTNGTPTFETTTFSQVFPGNGQPAIVGCNLFGSNLCNASGEITACSFPNFGYNVFRTGTTFTAVIQLILNVTTAGNFTVNLSGDNFSGTETQYFGVGQQVWYVEVEYDGGGSAGARPITVSSPQTTADCTFQLTVYDPPIFSFINCAGTPVPSTLAIGVPTSGTIPVEVSATAAGSATFQVSTFGNSSGIGGTYTTDLVVGTNNLQVPFTYDGSEIFFGFDQITIESIEGVGPYGTGSHPGFCYGATINFASDSIAGCSFQFQSELLRVGTASTFNSISVSFVLENPYQDINMTATGPNFSGQASQYFETAGQKYLSIPITYDGGGTAGEQTITVQSPQLLGTCTETVQIYDPPIFAFTNCSSQRLIGNFIVGVPASGVIPIEATATAAGSATFSSILGNGSGISIPPYTSNLIEGVNQVNIPYTYDGTPRSTANSDVVLVFSNESSNYSNMCYGGMIYFGDGIANDDIYSTEPGVPVSGDVSDNDDFVQPYVYQVSFPTNGTVQYVPSGFEATPSFTYTPNAGFIGNDTFSYRLYNGALDQFSTVAQVVIQVGTNTDPITDNHIKIDQLGYRPNDKKIAVISKASLGFNAPDAFMPSTGNNQYEIRRATDNSTVFTGTLSIWNNGTADVATQSGDWAWWFDFSSVTEVGTFYVYDTGLNKKSYEFSISEMVYADAAKQAVKALYYQRCGVEKTTTHGGLWHDAACHLNTQQDTDCRSATNPSISTAKDLSGGWHDAGDYNKYVNFAFPAVHDLLFAYEENPGLWGDDSNIPESGNGFPDILDELKVELDWLLKMQQTDGSVLSKVSVMTYSEGSPASASTTARRYAPANTTSALTFASMTAHAAKILENFPTMLTYANALETAAINAYNWAVANPNVTFSNGGYASADVDGNFGTYDRNTALKLTAAVYLYDLTGSVTYKNFVETNYLNMHLLQWTYAYEYESPYQDALLHYASLTGATPAVATAIKNAYRNSINGSEDHLPSYSSNREPYRAYMKFHTFNSNHFKANKGLLFHNAIKYNLNSTNNDLYEDVSLTFLNYLHGVNPLAKAYISNATSLGAENSVEQIYHLWFGDGTIYDGTLGTNIGAPPGFLVCGPDANYVTDGGTSSLAPPAGQPAQKSYLDFNTSADASWLSSEVAIYNQAAYARLLSSFSIVPNNNNCPNDLMLTGPTASGTYSATNTIESSSIIANATNVTFKAGTSITLQQGFHAMAGSNFTATIEACSASTLTTEPVSARTQSIGKSKPTVSLSIEPNPFSTETIIRFQLEEATTAAITVFDGTGKQIMQLMPPTSLAAGTHQIPFHNTATYNGLYFVTLQTEKKTIVEKVVILK